LYKLLRINLLHYLTEISDIDQIMASV